MNKEPAYNPPVVCDHNTNLLPFFESCVCKVRENGRKIFASITFETNYSDPLAILEQIHTPSQPQPSLPPSRCLMHGMASSRGAAAAGHGQGPVPKVAAVQHLTPNWEIVYTSL